jgi:hypothetical protein
MTHMPQNDELAQVSKQLDDLKRLMVVQLLASGVQSSHIAQALKVDPAVVSRMAPAREIQKVARKQGKADG